MDAQVSREAGAGSDQHFLTMMLFHRPEGVAHKDVRYQSRYQTNLQTNTDINT